MQLQNLDGCADFSVGVCFILFSVCLLIADNVNADSLWPMTKLQSECVAFGTLAAGLGINFILQSTSLIFLLIIVLIIILLLFVLFLVWKSTQPPDEHTQR